MAYSAMTRTMASESQTSVDYALLDDLSGQRRSEATDTASAPGSIAPTYVNWSTGSWDAVEIERLNKALDAYFAQDIDQLRSGVAGADAINAAASGLSLGGAASSGISGMTGSLMATAFTDSLNGLPTDTYTDPSSGGSLGGSTGPSAPASADTSSNSSASLPTSFPLQNQTTAPAQNQASGDSLANTLPSTGPTSPPTIGGTATATNPVVGKQPSQPLMFEMNQGQFDPQVQFMAHGPGYTLFLGANSATMALTQVSSTTPAPVQTTSTTTAASDQSTTGRTDAALDSAPPVLPGMPPPGNKVVTVDAVQMQFVGANATSQIDGLNHVSLPEMFAYLAV
jgi:hypothetical protein